MRVITLTTIPPRFSTVGKTLASVMVQRAPSDRVILCVPKAYRRFPGYDGGLPVVPAGVEIWRVPDQGPASKFLTVFDAFPSSDVLIADDDCLYDDGWLPAFQKARQRHPDAVLAASHFDTARLGLAKGHPVVQGFSGVLLRPDRIGKEVLSPKEPEIWVDDIWLSAHIARVRLQVVTCAAARTQVQALAAPNALQRQTIQGQSRADLNQKVATDLAKRYGIWGG